MTVEAIGRVVGGLALLLLGLRLADDIVRADDKIDLLDEMLTHYLTREAPDTLESDQEEFRRKLLLVIKDIEHVGDVVSKELVPLASKLERRERGFSEQGLAELKAFHADVAAGFERALEFVAGAAAPEVQEVLDFEAGISERSRALQNAHLARLERGVEAALVTSTIHVDLLTSLRMAHAYIPTSSVW